MNLKKSSSAEVEKVINNLSIVKTCQKDNILTKVIKMNNDIFAGFIAKDFNNCVGKGVFSDDLEHVDVTPVHKMKDRNDNTNYRSVIIRTNVSKIYENLIYNQLSDSFDDILSPSPNVVFARDTVPSIAYLSCLKKLKKLWAKAMNLFVF